MKNNRYTLLLGAAAFLSLLVGTSALAQEGKPWIHDPSTIVKCDGKYYTFGTGGGGLISPDGWNWESGAVRPGGGAAPDAMKIGDRYLVVYGSTGGGLGGGHRGIINTMWTKSLDPNSPDFGFSDPVVVAESKFDEDCDAIDPSLLLDPNTGRLWCSYGTYFGFIRIVELDPKTGARVEGNEAKDIAIDCEASSLIYRNGWYYLLGTHGTCCDGVNSTYNIIVGRSRNPQGPYVDNLGRDMIKGGGRMVIASTSRLSGAGHFGRYIETEGVEKMSCHFEADFDRSGRSVLAIRPLLWKNDWPYAGELFKEGVYEIESERRGYGLELAVDFTRIERPRRGGWWANPDEPIEVLPLQTLDEVKDKWPAGEVEIRIGDYLGRPHQRWSIKAVPEAGGYLGGQYYKIQIEGTERTLAATADREVIALPAYTGEACQLWRIEQIVDGTYRIMPKEVPGCSEELVLVSVADSTPSLGKFDPDSDNCKWNFRNH